MSKYTDFSDFLQEVVYVAGQGSPLHQTGKTSDLLKDGWASFLCAISVFGLTGGEDNIISEDEKLSLKAKRIGVKYKDKFDAHKGEQRYIDALIEEAANEIFNKTKT